MTDWDSKGGRRVPSSRLSRLAALGGLAGGVVGGVAAEGARRLAAGDRTTLRELLLTPGNANRIATKLSEMRGASMKLGQLLSMEAGDLLSPELREVLGRLRADARPMPTRQLKAVLQAAWGADFLQRFERFDVTPIAAASIGQVHRARTRDGRDLAIKIQYPGVRRSIDSDVDNVSALIRFSGLAPTGLDLAPLLAEAKRQLHEEADYDREAAELERFRRWLADDDRFETPAPHRDFSTDVILAMSHLDGRPIESAEAAEQGVRDRIAADLIRLALRELFEFGHMQTDPNFANFRVSRDETRIQLLDFGAARAIPAETVASLRGLLRAATDGDRQDLRQAALDVGFLSESMTAALQERILDMMVLARDALLAGGSFDFGSTALIAELRDRATVMAMERSVNHAPPIDVLFVQRKLLGLFLLATRLRARVDLRALADSVA